MHKVKIGDIILNLIILFGLVMIFQGLDMIYQPLGRIYLGGVCLAIGKLYSETLN